MPATSANFEGIGDGFTGPAGTFVVTSAPPDPNGAVGPNHFVEIVNTDFAIFNKSGTAVYGPVATNTLFTGFGGLCETDNDGDATVVYDQFADRWVVMQLAISGTSASVPFLLCIAVSSTGDPTGTYHRYSFSYVNFPDYPKLGVWPDAYYITVNQFNSSGTMFLGPLVAALDRSSMLNGLSATQQSVSLPTTYGSLLPASTDGPTAPPSGSSEYFMDLASNALDIWKFHVDWSNTTNTSFTGPTVMSVAGFSQACGGVTCIPQANTRNLLDSLGDRLMYRLAYRNYGDHESLVANHSVTAGASTGVRWYEIRSPGGTPTVYQQGTYAPDSSYRWMGSVAMDATGDLAAGFSVSSSTLSPQIHYAGRLAGDPLGQMPQGEASIIDGTGSQTNRLHRWGDYTSLAIDPVDDCTFWYTNEYLTVNGSFNWHTRVGSFRFPSCSSDFSINALPANSSAVQGGSTSYIVSTAVTKGSALQVTLSASGLPAGATATFNPTSVPAGSSSTMSVNVGTSTSAGTYSVTIQGNQSGGSTHSTTVGLTVTSSTQAWMAGYKVSSTPTNWIANETKSYSVAVTNLGTQTWPMGGPNPVHLGVHFANVGGGAGTGTWYTDQRFNLPADLPSGATATLNISVTAPNTSGNLVLEYQMVKEQQFWFAQFADATVSVAAATWVAAYTVSTPATWAANETKTYSIQITNNGNQTWPAAGSNPVRLGVHFTSAGGGAGSSSAWYTDQRFNLQADLAPGATGTLNISVYAPDTSGNLVLEYQMVKEQQLWFAQFADANVTVAAATWVAAYTVSTPPTWAANETKSYSIQITNNGNQTWPAAGSNPVRLGVHFTSAGGGAGSSSAWYTDQRFNLLADLAPGATATLNISVTAPNTSGNLVLEYQMVKEQQFWFAQFADATVSVAAATWVAAYTVSTPATWAANETKIYSIQIRNNGNQTWLSGGSYPVRLGVHFTSAGGGAGSSSAWYADQRFNLLADLAPGATATLNISVTAPNRTGNLVLEYQMVKEQQFWFAQFADANVTVA